MFLNLIKILNRFGRGNVLKKSISSSQQILERNYKINSNFNFIQVGANDGVSFDFLYEFVTKRNSAGIVIEPIKEYFKELMINYKNFSKIIKINKAIHPTEKEIIIYRISPKATDKYPDWVKGIASIDFEHHKKTNINSIDIENEIVEAETLMKIILENLNEEIIDYFQVDTEGFDFEILKMLDFTKVKPNIIKYESVNLSKENQDNALSLLRENGYYLFNEFGDTVGINLNKIKLF
jgi:FkbM family methyltransferase